MFLLDTKEELLEDADLVTIEKTLENIGVDLHNAMPYHLNAGSDFEHLAEPDKETVETIRKDAGVPVRQMRHCTRCRADAVGLLGAPTDEGLMNTLTACRRLDVQTPRIGRVSPRPCVAVASMKGVLVNQHLGEASKAGRP